VEFFQAIGERAEGGERLRAIFDVECLHGKKKKSFPGKRKI